MAQSIREYFFVLCSARPRKSRSIGDSWMENFTLQIFSICDRRCFSLLLVSFASTLNGSKLLRANLLCCRIPGVIWQGLSAFSFVTCKGPLLNISEVGRSDTPCLQGYGPIMLFSTNCLADLRGFPSSPLPLIGRKCHDTCHNDHCSKDRKLIISRYVSAYLGDPLLAPLQSIVNTFIGLLVFIVIVTIGICYSGTL